MKKDELENLSFSRIAEKEYNRIKKQKCEKGKIGLSTTRETHQMEVLSAIRRKFNSVLDKLMK